VRYWLLLGLLIGSLLLLDIGHRVHMITLGYEIEQLTAMRRGLERTNKELLIEKETLLSLDRVERIAVRSLGMKRPKPGQVIHVDVLPKKPERPGGKPGMTLVRNP
jgi:cell division protein FtsL